VIEWSNVSGVVTLLLTGVEDSSCLWEREP